ncbi:MAG: site-specific integrase [Rikenellaceae bacterium]
MTSIKAKFRPSAVRGKEGVIYYQVIHNKVIRQIRTNYRVWPHEWSIKGGFVVIDQSTPQRAEYLRLLADKINSTIRRVYQLAQILESRAALNHCNDLVEEYYRQPHEETFFNYFKAQIVRLESLGRLSTSHNYRAAFNSFFKFRAGEDLVMDNITFELIEEYQAFLKHERLSLNSSSFYMRILRAVYNKAVEVGLAQQKQPFGRVYTGIEKTVKRALSLKDLKRIKEFDTSANYLYQYARDMFMFSFLTRGMSFVDMAHLRKTDIKSGVLIYRRRKTGQLLRIKWELCMQKIVDKYPSESSDYLLPIIRNNIDSKKFYNRYKNELGKVNSQLKKIACEIGLTLPLTMYVARHSWASTARIKNIPISVISQGMGHDSEVTTQIYLASLDTSIIDQANDLIIRSL